MNQIVKQELYHRNEELFNKIRTIIEEFCREKKLIIYGGLAMDKHLKRLGHQGIYDNFETIDYDTYSTNYLEDSEELGKRIHSAGIPYIKIHTGFKATTRKIHITLLSTSVIDINDVSKEKYLALNPTDIDGLLYIRPDALFEDQIKNLVTNLYKDYYRIPKILKRIPLLLHYFPVIPHNTYIAGNVPENVHKFGKHQGILAGDFVFNYYLTAKFTGDPILYAEEKPEWFTGEFYEIEGETIFTIVEDFKIAPPALLLYFYFKKKINENTDKYDYQIHWLTKEKFPFPNYKEVSIYHPKPIISTAKPDFSMIPKKILLK